MTKRGRHVEALGPYSFSTGSGQGVTTDTLLLVDFALPVSADDRVIDLGIGCGLIPIMLAWKSGAGEITGVEIAGRALKEARENVEGNGLSTRITLLQMDYRAVVDRFPEGSFSLVISNPPYIRAGSGRLSPSKERAVARSEVHGGLPDLLRVSAHLAGKRGRVCFVFPVSRFEEMIFELHKSGLRPVRLQFVHGGATKTCKIFLIEARRSGALRIEEPVFLPA